MNKKMASKSGQAILTRGAYQLLSQGGKPLALMADGDGTGVAVGSSGGGKIIQIQCEIPELQDIKLSDRKPNGQIRIGKLKGIINRPG